jgi:Fe-S-cluster containining protein
MFHFFNAKYKQAGGKLRRLLASKFRRRYIELQLAKRRGECARCGACCRLLFRCPLLKKNAAGISLCSIHPRRPQNCRIFPLNEKDLHDRNLVNPKISCGYFFAEAKD